MAGRSDKRVTIADVAQQAGVSLATVSRALNGKRNVDPALAQRVRAAAEALDYTADPLARSLVLGRTHTIAVVVPDLGNPTFQEMLRGISRGAAADGYHVLVADSAESIAQERALAVTTRRRTDGVVLCAPRMPRAELRTTLAAIAPVVVVNRDPGVDVPVVGADYGSGLGDLMDHLYDQGHRRFVYLGGAPRSASHAARIAAIEQFRRRRPDVVVTEQPCGVDVDSGAAAADAIADASATAILAYNDLVAMGLMSALRTRGVHVPEDVSVAGFDDIPFARWTQPGLTTAVVPTARLGELAWEAMRALLGGQAPAQPVWLRPAIAIRASTGPPTSSPARASTGRSAADAAR